MQVLTHILMDYWIRIFNHSHRKFSRRKFSSQNIEVRRGVAFTKAYERLCGNGNSYELHGLFSENPFSGLKPDGLKRNITRVL
jgi:hypothetical protein